MDTTSFGNFLEKIHRYVLKQLDIRHHDHDKEQNIKSLKAVIFWLSILAILSIVTYSICLCKVLSKTNKKVRDRYKRFSQFFPGMFNARLHEKKREEEKQKNDNLSYGPHIPLNCPNRYNKLRSATPADGIQARLAEADLSLAIFPSVRNIKCHERGFCKKHSAADIKNKCISKRIRTETLNSLKEDWSSYDV